MIISYDFASSMAADSDYKTSNDSSWMVLDGGETPPEDDYEDEPARAARRADLALHL